MPNERNNEDVRHRAEELEVVMDIVPSAIFVALDADCSIITGNKMANRLYEANEGENLSAGSAINGGWDKTRRFFKDGRELRPGELPMQQAVAMGREVKDVEIEILLPSGNRRTMRGNACPLFNDRGQVRGAVASFLDITDRQRMEEELRRSNAELQQYSCVASHDLQEPLRMVTTYLNLLKRRYGDQLDEKAKEYLDFAVDGGERMKALIIDLLEYSKIDTKGKEFAPVNMNEVLDGVKKMLKAPIHENKAEIMAEPLPTISADVLQMAQLVQNLVGNAIKFHGPKPPKVRISVSESATEWTFAVKDNGIGIDPKNNKKLFQMFNRLHTRKEYSGTGIGLAISKKIVERHGGRIWVESDGKNGSTFLFTIPRIGRDLDERAPPGPAHRAQ